MSSLGITIALTLNFELDIERRNFSRNSREDLLNLNSKRSDFLSLRLSSFILTAVFSASSSSSNITQQITNVLLDPFVILNPGSPESSIKIIIRTLYILVTAKTSRQINC